MFVLVLSLHYTRTLTASKKDRIYDLFSIIPPVLYFPKKDIVVVHHMKYEGKLIQGLYSLVLPFFLIFRLTIKALST